MSYDDINTPEGMERAKLWTLWFVSMAAEGAVWGVPRSASIFRLYPSMKVIRKIQGEPDPSIKKVFEAIGWLYLED